MPIAIEIEVSALQRTILENWVKSKASTPHRLIERARIILMSSEGIANIEQGRRLGVDRQRVRRWRDRWSENEERLRVAESEGASKDDMEKLLLDLLNDEARAGSPPKFSAEQLTQIIGVACELPAECCRPVTHWTPRELVDEVIKRGIVESISVRHIDRLLKGGICDLTKANIG